jgi:hypothetical protein
MLCTKGTAVSFHYLRPGDRFQNGTCWKESFLRHKQMSNTIEAPMSKMKIFTIPDDIVEFEGRTKIS